MKVLNIEKWRGKEYRRVNRPGRGNLGKRTGKGTTRHDVFFDATRNGVKESLVRAWRGKTGEGATKALEAWYQNRNYQVKVDGTKFIENSIKD
ncbi:MAG TPA: hypothetical protein VK582_13720 [Pyrinomonadaceae bacterium]|nr:hypothetical protein [Pyrinomonadaceae bacterium]